MYTHTHAHRVTHRWIHVVHMHAHTHTLIHTIRPLHTQPERSADVILRKRKSSKHSCMNTHLKHTPTFPTEVTMLVSHAHSGTHLHKHCIHRLCPLNTHNCINTAESNALWVRLKISMTVGSRKCTFWKNAVRTCTDTIWKSIVSSWMKSLLLNMNRKIHSVLY